MKTVKGRYNGNTVVLDEPAPVRHAVDVVVQFPDGDASPFAPSEEGKAQAHSGGSAASSTPPPGLPCIPTPEEWARRVALLESVLDEWMADESGYDEETWPELKAALDRNRAEGGDSRKLFP